MINDETGSPICEHPFTGSCIVSLSGGIVGWLQYLWKWSP